MTVTPELIDNLIEGLKALAPEVDGIEQRLKVGRAELNTLNATLDRLRSEALAEHQAQAVNRHQHEKAVEEARYRQEVLAQQLAAEQAGKRAEIVGIQNQVAAASRELERVVAELRKEERKHGLR
jgi:hypothetical protein